jgi:hypothetical protein
MQGFAFLAPVHPPAATPSLQERRCPSPNRLLVGLKLLAKEDGSGGGGTTPFCLHRHRATDRLLHRDSTEGEALIPMLLGSDMLRPSRCRVRLEAVERLAVVRREGRKSSLLNVAATFMRVCLCTTFNDEDLHCFPRPVASVTPLLMAVNPDVTVIFIGDASAPTVVGCFQTRRSTSTSRWYHRDFLDDRPPDLAPPFFLHAQQESFTSWDASCVKPPNKDKRKIS